MQFWPFSTFTSAFLSGIAKPEVIEHGRTGLLVSLGRPREFAEAIVTLLKDEGLRRQLGEAGHDRVEVFFTVDRMTRQFAELYARTVGKRS